MLETFDHIVVGGGSSGCVAAARLAGEGGARVLLLEGGYSHRHPLLDMPPGMFKLIHGSRYMRLHTTTPQPQLGGRTHTIPQGNVLGGGSSVNSQVYMRGRPSDYDEWNEILRGNNDGVGWAWRDVLPHFRGMEDNDRLHNDLHGTGGPLQVSDPGHINEISRWFVQTVQALGVSYSADFNGEEQRGTGFYQFTNRAGRRSSTAYAFIAPQADNPDLTVRLRSSVQQILIENDRAVGVRYTSGNGAEQIARADGEVIVTAGAMVTPQLLMLSGIGPADHLAEHGIACVADLPGVGQNFIDHPEVPMTALVNGPYGYHREGEGWRMLRNGLQFKLFGSGPVTSSGVEAGGFVNPLDPAAPPSIQAFCVPMVYVDSDSKDAVNRDYGVSITTVVVKPKSRGQIRLASADPSSPPLVSPNMLSDPADMKEMIAAQRFFLRVFSTDPMAKRIDRVLLPTPGDDSDGAMAAHCRRFAKTNYHPAGTAKMGADSDSMAVLDARLRVRGVEGLRVSDMSAVPNINAGNTNACAMMLGDRCADMLMGRI